VQSRYGADKLAVVLIDVDPEFFPKEDDHLPQAKKILQKHKLDWPNVMARNGFDDTARAFNLFGYVKMVVDAQGIVRSVSLLGNDLERTVEQIMAKHDEKTPE
jgi:hypothetical protein